MSVSETLVGVAAILAGVGAVVTAWAGLRRARREAHDEGRRGREAEVAALSSSLAAARREAEVCARELHALRMRCGDV